MPGLDPGIHVFGIPGTGRLGSSLVVRYLCKMVAARRTIEVDAHTADVLEHRAAESGVTVSDLLADLIARQEGAAEASPADVTALDRQWAAIKAGEPTVPNADVVRWLDTWGTPNFRPWKG